MILAAATAASFAIMVIDPLADYFQLNPPPAALWGTIITGIALGGAVVTGVGALTDQAEPADGDRRDPLSHRERADRDAPLVAEAAC